MKYILIILLITPLIFSTSCQKREGCTDAQAINYDRDADDDDGSCIYEGCTDPQALNYRPDATIEGECRYYGNATFDSPISLLSNWQHVLEVYVDGAFVGLIQRPGSSDETPACEFSTNGIRVTELTPSQHSVKYYHIVQRSQSDKDTIAESNPILFTVKDNRCTRVILR